jgi:hypothetical protein
MMPKATGNDNSMDGEKAKPLGEGMQPRKAKATEQECRPGDSEIVKNINAKQIWLRAGYVFWLGPRLIWTATAGVCVRGVCRRGRHCYMMQ